jgi:hypothetical protein
MSSVATAASRDATPRAAGEPNLDPVVCDDRAGARHRAQRGHQKADDRRGHRLPVDDAHLLCAHIRVYGAGHVTLRFYTGA